MIFLTVPIWIDIREKIKGSDAGELTAVSYLPPANDAETKDT